MGRTVMIRVDEALEKALKQMKEELNKKMNQKFPSIQIDSPVTMASRLAAEKLNGKKQLEFKIKKNGLNKGHIEF